MHAAATHLEIDAVDRRQAAEMLGNPLTSKAIEAPESAGRSVNGSAAAGAAPAPARE